MEGQYENTVKSLRYAQEAGVDAVVKKMNMGKQVEYTTFSETICRMIHEIARQARELGIETTLWMANDYEVIDWAILHDIGYVSTDFPAKAVRYMTGVKEYR